MNDYFILVHWRFFYRKYIQIYTRFHAHINSISGHEFVCFVNCFFLFPVDECRILESIELQKNVWLRLIANSSIFLIVVMKDKKKSQNNFNSTQWKQISFVLWLTFTNDFKAHALQSLLFFTYQFYWKLNCKTAFVYASLLKERRY